MEWNLKFITIGDLVQTCELQRDCEKCEFYCFCRDNDFLNHRPALWTFADLRWADYDPEEPYEENYDPVRE